MVTHARNRTASDKQQAFIEKLCQERGDAGANLVNNALAGHRISTTADLTTGTASDLITGLMALPRAARRPHAQLSEPEAGMYRNGETIYRVYFGQQSGRMLLKRIVVDTGTESGYSYEYVGAAAYRLPPTATPLPLDEAKAWGRMTNTCCVCAKRLDVPESVDAGIGPKCARSFR